MLESLVMSLKMMSSRSVATADALGEAAEIADEEGLQEAIEFIQKKLPRMPRLVNIRPIYDDPETAVEAGEDPSMDDVESLLENAMDYAVVEPIWKSGILQSMARTGE